MLTTTINWIPGYPDNPDRHPMWWVMIKGYDWPCRMDSVMIAKSAMVTHHAPCEAPQEHIPKIINPSAREMIEAEREIIRRDMPVRNAKSFNKGRLHGLRFALECLDKEETKGV